jgi:hypothetical protein
LATDVPSARHRLYPREIEEVLLSHPAVAEVATSASPTGRGAVVRAASGPLTGPRPPRPNSASSAAVSSPTTRSPPAGCPPAASPPPRQKKIRKDVLSAQLADAPTPAAPPPGPGAAGPAAMTHYRRRPLLSTRLRLVLLLIRNAVSCRCPHSRPQRGWSAQIAQFSAYHGGALMHHPTAHSDGPARGPSAGIDHALRSVPGWGQQSAGKRVSAAIGSPRNKQPCLPSQLA